MTLNLPWHHECYPSPSSTHHGWSPHRCWAGFAPYSVPHMEVGRSLVSCTLSCWLCWGHSAAKVVCIPSNVGFSLFCEVFRRWRWKHILHPFFWLKDSPWGQAGCLNLLLQIAKWFLGLFCRSISFTSVMSWKALLICSLHQLCCLKKSSLGGLFCSAASLQLCIKQTIWQKSKQHTETFLAACPQILPSCSLSVEEA